MVRGIGVLALALVVGCHGGGQLDATGSQTVVASSSREAVYALNAEEGSLSVVGEDGSVREIRLGSEPARIARARDRVFVTLAGEATVVELAETRDGLEETARHAVGAEPAGIVASPDGKLVYVAITLEDRVEERDAATFEVVRSWSVADQPRWLAVHPSGRALFVASAMEGAVTRIDLREGTAHAIDLPTTSRESSDGWISLSPRLTGDPGITADGDSIAFPSLYVDNTTPVEDPTEEGSVSNGYASEGLAISRMNPAIVTYDLDGDGAIVGGSAKAVFAGGIDRNGEIFRSMPTSAVAGPDGTAWVVTLEGSDAVLLVGRTAFRGQGNAPGRGGDSVSSETMVDFTSTDCDGCDEPTTQSFPTPVAEGGFWERPILVLAAKGGPRGVVFTDDDTAWVHGWLGRSVSEVGYAGALPALEELAHDGRTELAPSVGAPRVIATSALPTDVERGRLLFNSAIDSRMVTDGAGVSCATCHLGNRSDGIVWTFEAGVRNTPSLAGEVSATAPFTWEGTVTSVAEEAEITSQGRMGGNRISASDLADIAAYIDWTRPVDSPSDPRQDALVALGAEVFNRPDTACATCHSGDLFTDNANHRILDFEAQTPTLLGVVASPPYLHDGSARSLRDVLDFARGGQMGDTAALSEGEMDALEAYLRSL